MKARFAGQVALITGASEGVGAAATRRFAREGADVVLVARREAPLEAIAAEVRALGRRALTVAADVADGAACARAIDRTLETFGRLDVLVNNAGAHARGPFEGRTTDEIATMVDVNVRGPLVLTRLALPALRARGGAVVNVASLAGQVPLPDAAVYSATKFALRAFSFALADELRDTGVRVSVVSPGPIADTGFLMASIEDAADVVFAQPMSTADEIAALVVEAAHAGARELSTPRLSSLLAKAAYLAPGLRRLLEPAMKARGARIKARTLAARARGR